MEKRINVAELLKDCPNGMELDCTMFDNVTLGGVDTQKEFPIEIKVDDSNSWYLTKEGCFHIENPSAKCVIFPKGKTTWEGFVPPCNFKDGDIAVTTLDNVAIIRKPVGKELSYVYGLMVDNYFYEDETAKVFVKRFATEEEKEKLFQAIKDNGYKWNAETKSLDKLIQPKFKVGDVVKSVFNNNRYEIIDITDTHYTLVGVTNKFKYTEPIIGDKYWKLVINKFDITNLKPFDKVLVRDNDVQKWSISFFSFYDNKLETYKYHCLNDFRYAQCVPYEENKHLLKTNNDCDGYYKTWEE